ncbi:AMP-binding protein [Nonomuraea ferruginea]|uniref:AMP-binding protein n=1 Tax=Nonomuraea ferruginea TaxID=46174 RepID=A0ABT4T0X0_9ACTN|nr:AMP-binding protein [Nonomuraea ferruginea]MDA0643163.1 AMP-binding protein [Nonomuraea ferruginea]
MSSATHSTTAPTGFYEIAAADPGRPAIIDPDGSTITCGDLLARVNRVSRALRSHGLSAGDSVAVAVHNGHEYLELMLATGQVGMFLVPVNWRLTPAEMLYIIKDSGARVVVADVEQARTLPEESLPEHRFVIGGQADGWRPYPELGEGEPSDAPPDRRFGGTMGYTSGTTGNPKGVRSLLYPDSEPEPVISALYGGLAARYEVTLDKGVHLVCSPIYHAAPTGHAYAFLQLGHTVVIQGKFDAEGVLEAIERHRVTSVHMVPTHFNRMLRLPEEVRARYDLSSLEAVIHAGAPCPVPIKQRMLDWLGPVVWEYLASTEGGVSLVSPREWLRKPGTVGRPTPNTIVKILGEDGEEVPTGTAGTIYFGIPGREALFEYNNDPAKTAASRRGGLATVGDYGYFDEDGYVFLLDRRTDLIISGGVNIYPAEIEQALITHPAVADVAVIGVPDPDWGQNVLAVVQPAEDAVPGDELAAALRAHCAERLASFKIPRRFEFRADFPRTETGKLQRRKLRDHYAGEGEKP